MSDVRLNYLKHAAIHALDVDATNSTVVRRALAIYQRHVEALLGRDATRIALERRALIAANKGDIFTLALEAITALPVRQLSEIKQDYQKAQPTVMDSIKRDLNNWSKADNEETSDERGI